MNKSKPKSCSPKRTKKEASPLIVLYAFNSDPLDHYRVTLASIQRFHPRLRVFLHCAGFFETSPFEDWCEKKKIPLQIHREHCPALPSGVYVAPIYWKPVVLGSVPADEPFALFLDSDTYLRNPLTELIDRVAKTPEKLHICEYLDEVYPNAGVFAWCPQRLRVPLAEVARFVCEYRETQLLRGWDEVFLHLHVSSSPLPAKWNYTQNFSERWELANRVPEEPAIVHFIGPGKPWYLDCSIGCEDYLEEWCEIRDSISPTTPISLVFSADSPIAAEHALTCAWESARHTRRKITLTLTTPQPALIAAWLDQHKALSEFFSVSVQAHGQPIPSPSITCDAESLIRADIAPIFDAFVKYGISMLAKLPDCWRDRSGKYGKPSIIHFPQNQKPWEENDPQRGLHGGRGTLPQPREFSAFFQEWGDANYSVRHDILPTFSGHAPRYPMLPDRYPGEIRVSRKTIFDGEIVREEGSEIAPSRYDSHLLLREISTREHGPGTACDFIDFVVTTRCTLACKNCNNLIQAYNARSNAGDKATKSKSCHTTLTRDESIRHLRQLFAAIPYIKRLTILGGETFLWPSVAEFCDALSDYRAQYGEARLVTNGTIMPSATVLDSLRRNRIRVSLSVYPTVPEEKRIAIKDALVSANVAYEEGPGSPGHPWLRNDQTTPHNRTDAENEDVFAKCFATCRSYYKGELHVCPRSAHGMDLGLIKRNPSEYADLNTLNGNSAKAAAEKILRKQFTRISACDICTYSLKTAEWIQAGT